MSALPALDMELLDHARRHLTVLEATQVNRPDAPLLDDPPACVASSAAAPPMHAAQEDHGRPVPAVPVALGSLSTGKLRSRVRATMEARGHKRVRWTDRERAQWHELVVVRGQAA